MKRLLILTVLTLILALCVSAKGTFEYILPTEFAQIEYGTYLSSGRYIKALDKEGKVSLYNLNGTLIIGGYDAITMYESGMGVGKKGRRMTL